MLSVAYGEVGLNESGKSPRGYCKNSGIEEQCAPALRTGGLKERGIGCLHAFGNGARSADNEEAGNNNRHHTDDHHHTLNHVSVAASHIAAEHEINKTDERDNENTDFVLNAKKSTQRKRRCLDYANEIGNEENDDNEGGYHSGSGTLETFFKICRDSDNIQ